MTILVFSLISSQNLDIKKAVGIDLNINEIALSSGRLIKNQFKANKQSQI